MATLIEEWQAGGGDAAVAFGDLTLRNQIVEVVKQFGRWEPWNLGVLADPVVYRARAYGVFAFVGASAVMHPDVANLSDIKPRHYAEVIQVWQLDELPKAVLEERKCAMSWLFECLTDPDACHYEMEGTNEID